MDRTKVAIIGSGNIGTDLMMKVERSPLLEVTAMVGVDPRSDGLARARDHNVAVTADGIDGFLQLPCFEEVAIVFDATSAQAHPRNAAALSQSGKRIIDLTPAALGPYVVPAVNLEDHLEEPNMNMVTCGGQATIPIVAAISAIAPVAYAEIVASIASKSAGPGTRANIDEFTETTTHAIKSVGNARQGKAIIILNPAEPPLIMRDTVMCLIGEADHDRVRGSVDAMVATVANYVPGYRLKQPLQFSAVGVHDPAHTLLTAPSPQPKWKVAAFLEVEGAADYLPAYAGNLDIMTSAAVQVAARLSQHSLAETI
ncbi:acetaldehyde dehydrogenase 1 [Mycobacterium saskatchewanense]|uniref:Acetaldehyde dehydrogenase n=1 Tax=Mycobacterium saskatchewanense TaxID=220927 RepID=A0AAJ3NKY5_9MYCO|nr:acetaldehyde dehydrogenase (acetylating) [Mycobacterium saskatchewanense]ORW65118.1 acetaldehyde dehydrogenase (acetylating) [Mycobacterium saskatchewanense]BBX65203.1 acetaldehyde dehydrogenase 1 [Mycobacterium saskatchewanense]